jgi:hypothetical protein
VERDAFDAGQTGRGSGEEPDVDERIKDCAARLLTLLGMTPEVNILLIPQLLDERSMITYEAVGWLAREGRVRTSRRGGQIYVSRSEGETEAHSLP